MVARLLFVCFERRGGVAILLAAQKRRRCIQPCLRHGQQLCGLACRSAVHVAPCEGPFFERTVGDWKEPFGYEGGAPLAVYPHWQVRDWAFRALLGYSVWRFEAWLDHRATLRLVTQRSYRADFGGKSSGLFPLPFIAVQVIIFRPFFEPIGSDFHFTDAEAGFL